MKIFSMLNAKEALSSCSNFAFEKKKSTKLVPNEELSG